MNQDSGAEIYLVRHGATAINLQTPPRLQGRGLDPPLDPVGRAQVARLAELWRTLPMDAIYSSPLRRAMETAAALGPHPIELPAATECDVGVWEGMSWPEIEARYPEALAAFRADPELHPYLGGEDHRDVLARAMPVIESLAEKHRGGRITLVTHQVVIRVVAARLLGIRLSQARTLQHDPTGFTVLRGAPLGLRLTTLNSAWHLISGR